MTADFLQHVRTAVDHNIPLIQIREKSITALQLFELTRSTVNVTRNSRTKVLVNDRVDVAIAAGADGVHLSTRSIPAKTVRMHVPEEFLIGVSTHSLDEVLFANRSGADFAVFGPIFDSPGKGDPVGLDQLRRACLLEPEFTVLALGGVNATNLNDVLSAGAAGFAAIRFLYDRDNIKTVSQELDL